MQRAPYDDPLTAFDILEGPHTGAPRGRRAPGTGHRRGDGPVDAPAHIPRQAGAGPAP